MPSFGVAAERAAAAAAAAAGEEAGGGGGGGSGWVAASEGRPKHDVMAEAVSAFAQAFEEGDQQGVHETQGEYRAAQRIVPAVADEHQRTHERLNQVRTVIRAV